MARLFEIITDSGCDRTEEYLKENGVELVKLGFTMDGKNYCGEDGEPIGVKEFYDKLREGAMPTTYQATAETARLCIEKSFERGKDVLVLAFSSGLSGTAGSFAVGAREACKNYSDKRKAIVVDTLCASMGQALFLYYVMKKADEGASLEETAAYAESLKLKICHNFTVDNLFHLKRGGRISASLAIVGSILKIKPVLHMSDEGKLVNVGKTMGRKKSLQAIVDNMEKTADFGADDPIYISHGDCPEDVEYLIGLIKARYPRNEITVGDIGPVIGCHSGAGTIAVFYKGTHR